MTAFIAMIVAAVTFQARAISKDASDLKELHQLEAVWNDAHVKGDAEALDKLWANDLIVTVASMPVMNKADSLAMVRSGRMPFLKYETSDLGVRPLGTSIHSRALRPPCKGNRFAASSAGISGTTKAMALLCSRQWRAFP